LGPRNALYFFIRICYTFGVMGSPEQQKIRFAEWNIQSGGFEGYNPTAKTPYHLTDIQEGVRQLNAAFVSLVDTYRWDTLYTNENLKHMFGFAHAFCINLQDDRLKALGHNNGITVLSNLDVQKFETIRIETRNAAKTTLQINEKPLDIISIYLDDVREKTRLEQMKALLQYVTPNRKTIILGDFNCISDRDVKLIEKTMKSILQNSPRNVRTKLYSVQEKLAHRGAIRFLETKGFIDADKKGQPTTPTHKTSPMISPFLRIDYAFCTTDIVIASTRVVQGKLFDRTSDHFPLIVEIES